MSDAVLQITGPGGAELRDLARFCARPDERLRAGRLRDLAGAAAPLIGVPACAAAFGRNIAEVLNLRALPVTHQPNGAEARALRMALAPFDRLDRVLRALAGAVWQDAIRGALRKADRQAWIDRVGSDGVDLALRQGAVLYGAVARLAEGEPARAMDRAEAVLGAWLARQSVLAAQIWVARIGGPMPDPLPDGAAPRQIARLLGAKEPSWIAA
ncbi:hypothetical protein [Marivita sp. GX14005]|uniref:hypothetical protein n=1 Tax=Marivita sp. GX14005 TaxID=2942276 RepID=UPI00201902EA|nr:hypothetical protein [Marivita sp. GX14005]MCL3883304.1 hypothetical protein [Marivita sp. GX14005]